MILKLKVVLSAIFLLTFTFINGCETTKGVAKYTKNLWQAALKADKWLKENLW